MTRIPVLAGCLALATSLSTFLNAQAELQSPFLENPATIFPYLEESTEFWIHAWDDDDQAFFSDVGLTGSPSSSRKDMLPQTRNAYAFAKAFQVTGDTDYLTYADGALRYLYDFGWDETYGGWWARVNANGSVNTGFWANDSRWSFWQHYMLLGPSAYLEVTGDPYHQEWLDRGNEINDVELWDDRPGLGGYYHDAALDWSTKWNKGFTPTVDAVTTSALTNYLMTRDPMRKQRLIDLGDNMVYMVEGDHDHVVSFPSEYDSDWNVLLDEDNDETEEPYTSIGHHIKTAWCLARVYLMEPDEIFRNTAAKLLDEIWNYEDDRGASPWDHENGIMRGRINVFNGRVDLNSYADWWTVEQGVTAGLMNWYITRRPEFLQMADQSMDFFMENFYDSDYGEVYSVVRPNGTVTDSKKGDMFKAGYHSIELFYLLYVYGNLYYHNQPVTLYYNFEAADEARTLHLWPVAYEDDRLIVSEVKLDGMPYSNYDGDNRDLSLPAGTGGLFEVTFESRYPFNPPGHFNLEWWEDWFGRVWLDRSAYPWLFHNDLGWVLVTGHSKDGKEWFYQPEANAFFHARNDTYPFIYQMNEGWVNVNDL